MDAGGERGWKRSTSATRRAARGRTAAHESMAAAVSRLKLQQLRLAIAAAVIEGSAGPAPGRVGTG